MCLVAILKAKEMAISKPKKFRSRLEENIAKHLESVGAKFEYETIRLPYIRKCSYTPDFILWNGVIVEAKGWFRSADRSKLALVKKASPWVDIRLVFQKATNRLSKHTKTTYAEWATKNGFPFAEGRVPETWLKERDELRKLTRLCKRFRSKVRGKAYSHRLETDGVPEP